MIAFGRYVTLLQLAMALLLLAATHPTFTAEAFSLSMSAAPLPAVKSVRTTSLLKTQSSLDDEALRRMQEKNKPIAASFVPSKFDPHPALTNRHLQTILGVFLRKNPDCAYVADAGWGSLSKVLGAVAGIDTNGEDTCAFYDERHRVTTHCEQDFYTVDVKYAGERSTRYQSKDSKGTVIVIHGLESNSNSSLSTDLGASYVSQGFDVVCMNFRGCCGSPNESLGGYHLGFTDDLRHFLKLLSEMPEKDSSFDKRPVYLSGFSLGANVVTKCLGELGDDAMNLYNIHGAAVTGAPFDCERNIPRLDTPGFSKAVYGSRFLESMKNKWAKVQLDTFCEGDPQTELFDYEGCMAATTIAEFETAFIAKVYGFEDNIDYYRNTSCMYFLPGVAVPLFIINAGDDPFFDPDFFPTELGVDGGSQAPVKMERTEQGGHLGYLFHQLSDAEKEKERSASWMPMELARFIDHVHNYEADEEVTPM